MISWMSNADHKKASKSDCKKCIDIAQNMNTPMPTACVEHELEYANQIVKVINCEFLDPEKPEVGKPFINSLIIGPDSNISWLIDHIEADEYEGRTTVLSLTTKRMTRDELNTLAEWEP